MRQSLLNIARLVSDSGKDASVEASFLKDFEYTCRQLNNKAPHYYFKKIERTFDSEYFNVNKASVNISCVFVLPEPCEEVSYEKTHVIYHTNEQEYFVCLFTDGKPSTHYKPSSLQCMRNMYFQATGTDLDEQQDIRADAIGISESGTDRHERIQYVVSKMSSYGVDCEFVDVETFVKERNLPITVVDKRGFETKLLDEERNLTFMCDGLIKYKGEYYILEIKTESQYKWNGRNSVDNKHKYQAWTYSLELGIDNVIFIYENRDLCSKKPYMLSVSDDDRKFIADRLATCSEYVRNKKVPPREESVTERICQYCNYRSSCRACGDT